MKEVGFKQFASEAKGTMWATFGRFQPPTTGHTLLIERLKQFAAGSAGYRVYTSQSHDPKKNPLEYKKKVAWMKKMWPEHKSSIQYDPSVKTLLSVAEAIYKDGYTHLGFVVGSDRIADIQGLLEKYNGIKTTSGFYNFRSIKVMSAGGRDPDAEGVVGMSATKMRNAAAVSDLGTFKLGLPAGFKEADKLMADVRSGMAL